MKPERPETNVRYLQRRKGELWREKYPGFVYLITPGESSTKTEKSNKLHQRYFNAIQYLAPATMAGGPNLCPSHTPGCYGLAGENCIAGAGRLAKSNDTLIARTKFFLGDRAAYLERLLAEIDHLHAAAKARGKILALRLNGTSDIPWERLSGFSELFGRYPDVVFYDYTKVVNRVVKDGKPVALPENYHLTFSQSELNFTDVEQVIRHTKVNVAKVFPLLPGIAGRREPDPLPDEWMGRRVIDGDKHDLRFPPIDPKGVIIGLRAKGDSMRAAVKALRVLTNADVELPPDTLEILPENIITPEQKFLLKDSVKEPERDPKQLETITSFESWRRVFRQATLTLQSKLALARPANDARFAQSMALYLMLKITTTPSARPQQSTYYLESDDLRRRRFTVYVRTHADPDDRVRWVLVVRPETRRAAEYLGVGVRTNPTLAWGFFSARFCEVVRQVYDYLEDGDLPRGPSLLGQALSYYTGLFSSDESESDATLYRLNRVVREVTQDELADPGAEP